MGWRRGTVWSPQQNRAIILDDSDQSENKIWYYARYDNCAPEAASYNRMKKGEKVAFRDTYLGNNKYGASEVLRLEELPLERLMEVREVLCQKGDILKGKHDKYILIEELGVGAAGIVWQAKSIKEGHDIALKILCPSMHLMAKGKLENVHKRFCRERSIGMKINHSNIVKYLDEGSYLGLPFCCLELCDHSVAEEIREKGNLALAQTVQIVSQVIEGLRYIHGFHGLGIVHRDVKPANILIRSDGSICLGDLGIIHVEDTRDEITAMSELTGSTANLGSWYYMAPEQRRANGRVGPMADVYSLGVSWYEMLEGGPVPGPERFATKDYSFRDIYPNPLHRVISQMMEYAPENRPALDKISSSLRFAALNYEKEIEQVVRFGLVERGAEDVNGQTAATTRLLLPLLGFSEKEIQSYLSKSGYSNLPPIVSDESGEILNEAELDVYLRELANWVVEIIADHEISG